MPSIKLYANLRNITGKSEVRIPGNNLREVLERLIREFPELQAHLFTDERVRVIITLNRQTLDQATTLDTPVTQEDKIAIFPPVSGG